METKISADRVVALKQILGFARCFAMDSDGLSGGIGLFWSTDVSVDVKNFSSCHIDAMVRKTNSGEPEWRFTGFYGAPKPRDRHHSWRAMRTLAAIEHPAWLCVGDFNETLYATEHFSRAIRPEWQMRAFREAVEDCSLTDLGWSGVEYTWDNGQMGVANVKARLDRAFGDELFVITFAHYRVRHIVSAESDHCFVFVEFRKEEHVERAKGARQFRYEDVWQTHVDYDKLILDKWQRGAGQQGLSGVVDALSNLQTNLSVWGAKEFGCLARKVRKLREKLNKLRTRSVGRGPNEEEKSIVKQLKEALRQEEIWMKQRSRVQWLREGDRNTAYFHAQASQRKRVNKIENLEREDGSRCATWDENCTEVQSFFQNLYTSQGFRHMDELLNLVPTRVTMEMNAELQKAFTAEEVKGALFQMAPFKAPGVDGFTAGFFQRHWLLLKDDIVPAILDFLNGGELW
jgi:hypothetical protein